MTCKICYFRNTDFLILMFLCFSLLFAEDGKEKLFSLEEETYHSTELSDFLEKLQKHPLNLNTASRTVLSKLPWLSENDIDTIIVHRKSTLFLNWKQLENIGINEITVQEIKPYFQFSNTKNLHFHQTARIEFQEKDKNLPSTTKYLQKTFLNINKFKFAFISQKDSGEKNLFDYYSYFAEYHGQSFLSHIILGKYRVAFGQGILFAPKLGMSKSAESTTVPVKKYKEIKPYTSSYENWYLEGFAGHLHTANFNLFSFFSKTKLTANLAENGSITSFDESGVHFENKEKNNVEETIYGGEISKKLKFGNIGIVLSHLQFDREFESPEIPHKYFVGSFHYRFNFSEISFFGENAYSHDKFATVNGIKWGKNKLHQLLLFRFYDKYFPTWQGHPFSTQSNFDNEIGIYFATSFLPSNKTKLNVYFDLWKFPQTRYFEKMPTVGSEQFFQLELKSRRNSWRFTLQNKNKEKYKSLDGETKIRDFDRTLFRCDWWQFLSFATLKTRMELVAEYLPENKVYKKGILAYEQLKFKKSKLEFVTRIALYHSEILLYMYENNVSGIMQNSIFSGDGIYSFFLMKFRIKKSIEIQFKIADNWFETDKMKLYFQTICNF